VPLAAPYDKRKATPVIVPLPIGTELWRVHPDDRPATDFNEMYADEVFGGSRFDGTPGDPYSFLYAAMDCQTALLETLGRSLPFDHRGWRLILRRSVRHQCISQMEVTTQLQLISLMTGEQLAAVCQDEWLVQADPEQYSHTRRWCSWLRKCAPSAQGIVWPSRRNLGHQAIVLFGDKCGGPVAELVPDSTVALYTDDGAAFINDRLANHRMYVRGPAHHGPALAGTSSPRLGSGGTGGGSEGTETVPATEAAKDAADARPDGTGATADSTQTRRDGTEAAAAG
jgi:hypothetical protein